MPVAEERTKYRRDADLANRNLLQHKSWNIYNPKLQERIARDEAEAQEREEAQNKIRQEYDAAKRYALLRGESPPPAPELLDDGQHKRRRRDNDYESVDTKRQRRKLTGEDDTDRDVRLARGKMADDAASKQRVGGYKSKGQANTNAPIVDDSGHSQPQTRAFGKGDTFEALKDTPWYSNASMAVTTRERALGSMNDAGGPLDSGNGGLETEVLSRYNPTDRWGQPDQARKERAKARMNAADPLNAMITGWGKQKEYETAKSQWRSEQNEKLEQLKKEQEKAERDSRKERRRDKHRRRRRSSDLDSLGGFSLDPPAKSRGLDSDGETHQMREAHRSSTSDGKHRVKSEKTRRHSSHRHSKEDKERSGGKHERHKDTAQRRNKDGEASAEERTGHSLRSPRRSRNDYGGKSRGEDKDLGVSYGRHDEADTGKSRRNGHHHSRHIDDH